MKLYLDDIRKCPDGWIQAFTASEAINILKLGYVTDLSLDHDLGEMENGTGADVTKFLMQQVFEGNTSIVPANITIHSANPVGIANMESDIRWILQRMQG